MKTSIYRYMTFRSNLKLSRVNLEIVGHHRHRLLRPADGRCIIAMREHFSRGFKFKLCFGFEIDNWNEITLKFIYHFQTWDDEMPNEKRRKKLSDTDETVKGKFDLSCSSPLFNTLKNFDTRINHLRLALSMLCQRERKKLSVFWLISFCPMIISVFICSQNAFNHSNSLNLSNI